MNDAQRDILTTGAYALAILSPYNEETACAILEAIATCRPMSEIVRLLECSYMDVEIPCRCIQFGGAPGVPKWTSHSGCPLHGNEVHDAD